MSVARVLLQSSTTAFSAGATIAVVVPAGGADYIEFDYQDENTSGGAIQPTFNGVNMTLLQAGTPGSAVFAERWGIAGSWVPGTYNLVYVLNAAVGGSGRVVRGYLGAGVVTSRIKTSDTGGDYTDTIASVVNGLVSDFIAIDNALGVVTATGANTALVNTAFSYLGQCMAASQAPGAASVVMSWHNTVNSANNVQIISSIAPVASTSAAVTGTGAAGTTGNDERAGGKTYILTLAGDTFLAFDDTIRAAIRSGIVSGGSETWGFNARRSILIPLANIVRTSATVCTITEAADPGFQIDATETRTFTIPASALTGGVAIVATPTVAIAKTSTDLTPVDDYTMAGTATRTRP